MRLKKITRQDKELGITLIEYHDEAGGQIDQEMEFPQVIVEMLNSDKLFDLVMDWTVERAHQGTVTEEWEEQGRAYKVDGATIEFQKHVDRTKAGELLIAAGMNGLQTQLCRSVLTLEFVDSDVAAGAAEILKRKKF